MLDNVLTPFLPNGSNLLPEFLNLRLRFRELCVQLLVDCRKLLLLLRKQVVLLLDDADVSALARNIRLDAAESLLQLTQLGLQGIPLSCAGLILYA